MKQLLAAFSLFAEGFDGVESSGFAGRVKAGSDAAEG
jgi:hypothetical protein